jgi:hypothetical protein
MFTVQDILYNVPSAGPAGDSEVPQSANPGLAEQVMQTMAGRTVNVTCVPVINGEMAPVTAEDSQD